MTRGILKGWLKRGLTGGLICLLILMPNVLAVSEDIKIEVMLQELHDDSAAEDDFTQATLGGTEFPNREVSPLNSTAVLRFDGNYDSDLKDQTYPYDDYDLYNHMVVINENNGDIQFAYKLTEHETYSNADGNINAGEVVTIKGNKYVITDNETSDSNITLGPAIYKTLTADTVDKDKASTITGTKKMLYGNDGTLRFYDGGAQVETPFNLAAVPFTPWKLNSSVITSDEFTPYDIYIVGNFTALGSGTGTVKVTLVEKSEVFNLTNDQAGAMGYSSVKIDDPGWFTNGTSGIFFLSDPITLVKDNTVELPDTYYALKYTVSKQFDILRKKISMVASGTKLRTNVDNNDNWLNDTITLSVVSGDIKIEFNSPELHDDYPAQDDYTQSTFASAGYADVSVNALNASAVLRFDGNEDNDLSNDPYDYDLYNHLVIMDQVNGEIQFAYKLSEHSTYSNNDGDIDAGDVVVIKGSKYVITDSDTSDMNIKLGPAIYKTLTADTVDKDKASTITGTKALLYGIDGTLRFYNDGSQVETPFNLGAVPFTPWKLNSSVITSEYFTPYNIYIVGNFTALGSGTGSVKVTLVEKSEVSTLTNNQAGAMGYDKVKIADPDWFINGTSGIFFLSDPITLVKDDTVELPDTYYALKYTSSSKFDILRKKISTVASGTKIKANTNPGRDFLKEDIVVTVIVPASPADTTPPKLSFGSQTPINNFNSASGNIIIEILHNETNPDTLILFWNNTNESYTYLPIDSLVGGGGWRPLWRDYTDSFIHNYHQVVPGGWSLLLLRLGKRHLRKLQPDGVKNYPYRHRPTNCNLLPLFLYAERRGQYNNTNNHEHHYGRWKYPAGFDL